MCYDAAAANARQRKKRCIKRAYQPFGPLYLFACVLAQPSCPSAIMFARAVFDSVRWSSRVGTHVQSSLCPSANPLHHGAQLCHVGEPSFHSGELVVRQLPHSYRTVTAQLPHSCRTVTNCENTMFRQFYLNKKGYPYIVYSFFIARAFGSPVFSQSVTVR